MIAQYIGHMGSDLEVVNDARVSMNKASCSLTESDVRLISYLARGVSSSEWNGMISDICSGRLGATEAEDLMQKLKHMATHWTPFAQQNVKLYIEAPIFLARQDFKHQIGFVRNEVSRRYVDDETVFFKPKYWRKRPEKSIKQGSGGKHLDNEEWEYLSYDNASRGAMLYDRMIHEGVAPEQARMVLPQSMMTAWRVNGTLASWARAYNQRSDSHAQKEIQDLYAQIGAIISPLFPYSWAALTGYKG